MSAFLPPQAPPDQGPPLPGPSGPVPGGLYDQGAPPPEPAADGGLGVLQDCIECGTQLLAALHDPQDVNQAASALKLLTGIQARLMAQAQSGPQG